MSGLLDQSQVMKRYGVTRQALWSWRRKYRLPAIKIGGSLFFRAAELELWEESHRDGVLQCGVGATHIPQRAPAVTQ